MNEIDVGWAVPILGALIGVAIVVAGLMLAAAVVQMVLLRRRR